MSKTTKKSMNAKSVGPCGEYNCPTCIFSKSHAPGDPYDISKCPKYNSAEKVKKSQ